MASQESLINTFEMLIHRMDRIEKKLNRLDRLETKIDRLDKVTGATILKLDAMEKKIDRIDSITTWTYEDLPEVVHDMQFDRLVEKVDRIEASLSKMNRT